MVKPSKLILVVDVRMEHDVVLARQRSRQIAGLLGFSHQDQSRISTAVSEIARNAYTYAKSGRVEFGVETRADGRQSLTITIRDKGPGIPNVEAILDGQYVSKTGLGLGVIGAKRLMDDFEIRSGEGEGTTVVLRKLLPAKAEPVSGPQMSRIAAELAQAMPENPLAEVQQQNRELLRALEELRARQTELAQLNSELEDTNRGVVALYAELDERADYLQRASELKSRFLSNMSHEFRTPLNAILSLSRIVLSRVDGDLTAEQEKQVTFIRKSAESLSELVNDLLDLARVEAGKIVVRAREFDVPGLFSALRGMLRPMLASNSVDLVFEEPAALPIMYTDDSKVSQVLRNFISNALKFTERGEVRVSAALSDHGQYVVFSVSDTGIGIAPEDLERIFQEWAQIDSPIQRKVKGTGLGLPLSRKLAELLGGKVEVQSQPGLGSTFRASIPVVYRGASEAAIEPVEIPVVQEGKIPVLAIEDNQETLMAYESYLRGTQYQLISASRLGDARRVMQHIRPAVVILDILLHGESTWTYLTELKSSSVSKDLPVIVVTVVDNRHKARALGADAFYVKPLDRETLVNMLDRYAASRDSILIVDDEEVSRYLLKGLLSTTGLPVVEASNAQDALKLARQLRPRVIFLDLMMPEVSGYELLGQLRADPVTASVPVIVNTSKILGERERDELAAETVEIISKQSGSQEEALRAIQAALLKAGIAPPETANAR